jgi:hypothetical protein
MSRNNDNWGQIFVDLDGCLADAGESASWDIGAPIPLMVNRVKEWLTQGEDVRIFTARCEYPSEIPKVQAWCAEHLGAVLPVTNVKTGDMRVLYDDRAVQVIRNTGVIVERFTEHIGDLGTGVMADDHTILLVMGNNTMEFDPITMQQVINDLQEKVNLMLPYWQTASNVQ